MNHVIIGNGPTGMVASETLRHLRKDAEIYLIGDEGEPPYSRMAIPYYLHGNISEEGTYLRKDPDYYEQHHIHLVHGRVERLEPAKKQLVFDDGRTMDYQKLLIATGSRPIIPPIPGIDLPNVHTCWTLEDARAIAAKAKPGTRVVQLGAGFIGCIIMESLAARGAQLTVVEMGDRMVPRMMTATAGAMIRRWVEEKGVSVHVDSAITRIEQDGQALRVTINDDHSLQADLIICAAGVRPNIEFLQGSGLELANGVLVDKGMRTNIPDIYAAGDVAEAEGFHSGTPELNAIQPNAADQARVAAHNMAGDEGRLQGSLAINVLDTLGLISTSFGQWMGASENEGGSGVELVDPEEFRYLSLQFQEDVLIGATSIGWTDHVGALRGLIQTRSHLGEWKERLLADPTQFMSAYLARGNQAA